MTNNEYTPTSKNDLEVDAISRAQAQTKIEMNASRYTIARECGGMGQVEWSDQLIKVSDAVDIIRHLPSVTPQDIDYKAQYERLSQKAEIVISQLRADRDRLIRPKGHWICDGKGRSFADYHCSECGLKLALCGQDIKQRQDSGYSLFCGGCGADMRGEE